VKKVNSGFLPSQGKMRECCMTFNSMTGFLTMEILKQMGGVSL